MQNQSLNKYFRRICRNWQAYVLILPAIVSVFIFHYMPFYGIQIAFKDFRANLGIMESPWEGLKNFERFISYPYFWEIMKNTVSLSLYSLATFPCSFVFALMVNELNNKKYKKAVQMIAYAPHFVPMIVLCSMIILFTSPTSGVINSMIEALGGQRFDFMTDTGSFRSLYVWSGVWQNLGWGTIIYLATLSNVSPEWIEAARIDGANRFQIVGHILIPFLLPTAIILLILNTGSVLSVGFEKVFLLQNPLNLPVSQVISTYVYEIGLVDAQFSYSTAISLFNNILQIIIIVIVNGISKAVTQVGLF